ncbi:glycosyltransferase family 2 protein [Rhizomicrobium electricum]|jgi:glycosyltransferase involved in cell wall biosynthesis|uniref:Glycosyltransferase 2-like domain-containing protein n=1 Tax=Rhizomicrobium electricum TaxID=480070 RepID=A0ABP3PM33_9PROT|nr:glycosyltransferase family 2 protein [Rhizomicrobium electricum]NIJ46904.1 glycosyltransferase involved in cell wall biosynthesis [Rhizomicrobium electricum]
MRPTISVVIATKNRAPALKRLLACIRDQDMADLECIVVDDGSSPDTLAAYNQIWIGLDERFQLHLRQDRQPGGPSRMRNRGIALARGKYIAFCDDDDRWIRNDHLSTAVRVLEANGGDLFFAAMQTAALGEVKDPDLYAPARAGLQRNPIAGETGIFQVPVEGMIGLIRHRTLHTDTLVAARTLLHEAGLYWEKTSLAEDRDFSFRLVDRAKRILFRADTVGELDVSHHVSLYRTFAHEEKALFAYLATLHSEFEVRNPKLRRLARANRAWDLLDLTRAALADGRRQQARQFALESLLLHPSFSALRLLAA